MYFVSSSFRLRNFIMEEFGLRFGHFLKDPTEGNQGLLVEFNCNWFSTTTYTDELTTARLSMSSQVDIQTSF